MQWPLSECVLKHIPASAKYPVAKLQGRELFKYLRNVLVSGEDVCTIHNGSYFSDAVLIKLILRSLPNPCHEPSQNQADILVSVLVCCEDLGIQREHSIWVLPLNELWRMILTGNFDHAISKRWQLEQFGKKPYFRSLMSTLNRHLRCKRGLYKLKLTCEQCNKVHQTFVVSVQK